MSSYVRLKPSHRIPHDIKLVQVFEIAHSTVDFSKQACLLIKMD